MEKLFKLRWLSILSFQHGALIICCCFITHAAYSQNYFIDSLRSLETTETARDLPDLKYQLAIKFMLAAQYDSADRYCQELISIGRNTGDSLPYVRGHAIKASVLRRTGFIDSAMKAYNRVLPIARRNSYDHEALHMLNSLGLLYTFQARYDVALNCHFESLAIRELRGNKFDISISLNNIGLLYYKLFDIEKALSFYTRSLQLKYEIGDKFDLDKLLLNIGLCYEKKGDLEMARKYVGEAFLVCGTACSDDFLVYGFFAKGLLNQGDNDYDMALNYFLKSYALSKEVGDIRFQFDNAIALSQIYIKRNKERIAEKYLKAVELLMAKDSKYNIELLAIYSQFINLYRKTNDSKKIMLYQDKYITLRESIFNEEVASNLMKAEAGYVEKQNQAKIESQNQIMALNNEVIRRQQIVNIFFGAVVVLVIMLAIVLARSNKQKHLINKLLDQKVRERTHELILNRDALQRAWLERDALMHKASSDIKRSVATIKGLVFLGLKDVDHANAPQYLHRLNTNFDHLADVVNKIVDSNGTTGSIDKVNS